MKIVIDIPDNEVPKRREIVEIGLQFMDGEVCECTYPFQILPKGHGRLIDADDLIQDIIDDNQLCLFNSESERMVHDKMVDFAIDRITEAFPIIEADKEEGEKNG